jgi:hypothetical protein
MKLPKALSTALCLFLAGQALHAQSSPYLNTSANELRFTDNGQIKSLDDAHRILFRRSENILEFREFGRIVFSPGAQATTETAKMTLTEDGNLGVGSTGPRGKIDIWGGALYATGPDYNGTLVAGANSGFAFLGCNSLTNGIAISAQGTVGLGTTSPQALFSLGSTNGKKLLVYDGGNASSVQAGFGVDMSGSSRELSIFHSTSNGSDGDISFGKRLESSGTYTETMRITGSGSVGIGTVKTNDAAYKLFVETGIRTAKVKIDLSTNWPDYVFRTGYRLRPLSEVEQYINQYHHLPDVASAEQLEKNGIDVAENQAMLMKKIEELTLYVIEQDKQIKKLASENREMNSLKKEVEELKTAIRQMRK